MDPGSGQFLAHLRLNQWRTKHSDAFSGGAWPGGRFHLGCRWFGGGRRPREVLCRRAVTCGVIYGNHILNCSASMEDIS